MGIHQDLSGSVGVRRGPSGSVGIRRDPSGSVGIRRDPSGSVRIRRDPISLADDGLRLNLVQAFLVLFKGISRHFRKKQSQTTDIIEKKK